MKHISLTWNYKFTLHLYRNTERAENISEISWKGKWVKIICYVFGEIKLFLPIIIFIKIMPKNAMASIKKCLRQMKDTKVLKYFCEN